MSNKVVLITGGSSGIGKSIGIFLTAKGYTVYGTTRDKAKYPNFNHFNLVNLDVRNTETINEAVSYVIEQEGRLDVLVNNAGVGITGPIEETPNQEIINAFDVNLNGLININEGCVTADEKTKKRTNYKYYLYCGLYGLALQRNLLCK